ncbi:MAG: DUF3006 domain-containing protein [Proteobacteria bacterium]|nr:DUF3006 domain-containing protein [Pseudomonadota bacterium]
MQKWMTVLALFVGMMICGELGAREDAAADSNQARKHGSAMPAVTQADSHTATRQHDESILVVDRIEGDDAVLETASGAIRVPCSLLPSNGRREGAVLILTINASEEQKRLEEGQARITRLLAASQ